MEGGSAKPLMKLLMLLTLYVFSICEINSCKNYPFVELIFAKLKPIWYHKKKKKFTFLCVVRLTLVSCTFRPRHKENKLSPPSYIYAPA